MKALTELINRSEKSFDVILAREARAELAALRAAAKEAHDAHVYLDESYVNDPDAEPMTLANRIAALVNGLQSEQRNYAGSVEILTEFGKMLDVSNYSDVLPKISELRATVAAQADRIAALMVVCEADKRRIAELEAAVSEARDAMLAAMDYLESLEYAGHCYQLMLNWYSKHPAPAPQPASPLPDERTFDE